MWGRLHRCLTTICNLHVAASIRGQLCSYTVLWARTHTHTHTDFSNLSRSLWDCVLFGETRRCSLCSSPLNPMQNRGSNQLQGSGRKRCAVHGATRAGARVGNTVRVVRMSARASYSPPKQLWEEVGTVDLFRLVLNLVQRLFLLLLFLLPHFLIMRVLWIVLIRVLIRRHMRVVLVW